MTDKPIEGEKRAFMTGNEAVTWAALVAGAQIMYGYPITPQNEIMHYWTRMAPKYNRSFLQTEDELSAGFTCIGGVLAGKKAFTATAGPGTVLMQEPMSMAEMMRIPVVAVICQRGGAFHRHGHLFPAGNQAHLFWRQRGRVPDCLFHRRATGPV